jgi:hypothetical protein
MLPAKKNDRHSFLLDIDMHDGSSQTVIYCHGNRHGFFVAISTTYDGMTVMTVSNPILLKKLSLSLRSLSFSLSTLFRIQVKETVITVILS